jgi:hypothetical protein
MTLREFAQSVIDDPDYRATITTRARAGTLPEEIELFMLEMAGGRTFPSLSAECVPAPTQSVTLALIRRPLATVKEEEQV